MIIAKDENGNKISLKKQKNDSEPISSHLLQSKLYKLDENCEFAIENIFSEKEIYIKDSLSLREEVFELLRKERAINRPKLKGNIEKNNYPYYKKNLSYLDNVTNKLTETFYKRHLVENIEQGLETGISTDNKKVFSSRYCLKYELGFCTKEQQKNIPPQPWHLTQLENGNKFKIEFDCKKCSMYLYDESRENK